MKFLTIEIKDCRRLMDGGTNYLHCTFTSATQIILGTNGSGKSSLLRLLTPLPASSDSFVKGGFCNVLIEHKNKYFYCRSNFENSKNYYFGVSDVLPSDPHNHDWLELNDGRTQTAQKMLVKEYFNITPDIHELLLSSVRFHEMNPNERRKFFTMLSDVNYDYGLSIHKKLTERLRDVKGAIKILQKSVSNARIHILSDEDIKYAETVCGDMEQLLNYFMELKSPQKLLVHQRFERISRMVNDAKSFATMFNKSFKKLWIRGMTLDGVRDECVRLQSQVTFLTNQIRDVSDEHDKYDQTLTDINSVNVGSLEVIEQQEKQLRMEYEKLSQQLSDNIYQIPNPMISHSVAEMFYGKLTSLLFDLPTYKEGYSRERFESLTRNLELLNDDIDKTKIAKENTDRLLMEMLDARDHDPIACPQCNHKWTLGYNAGLHHKLELDSTNYKAKHSSLVIQRADTEAELQEVKQYQGIVKQIATLRESTTPALDSYWNSLDINNYLQTNPLAAHQALIHYTDICRVMKESESISQGLVKIEKEKQAIERAKSTDKRQIELSLFSTETKLSKLTAELVSSQKKLLRLQKQHEIYNEIVTICNRMQKLKEVFECEIKDAGGDVLAKFVNEVIQELQIAIGNKRKQISNCQVQKAIAEDGEIKLQAMEKDFICYEHLVNELSPTTGLIGEGMFGFIELYITQLNAFIEKVWTYPMLVQPCSRDALDYRFPIYRPDTGGNISDISQGSGAMMEVISLGFKILAMRHLGLDDFPVPLDEFGVSFDSTHRQAAIELTGSLLSNERFTQLFIVSHMEEQIMTLEHAETMVLCPLNVSIPPGVVVNKHISKH